MVAQKRGRGAKAQAAKQKAAQAVEEVPEAEVPEPVEEMEGNNGDSEQVEQGDEGGAGDAPIGEAQAEGEAQEGGDAPAEEPKEEKVESGKLLVENLPASYLFDYQEKLKEIFSKHGEINAIKRGPIIVTEQTITPTLSAIVEFKNKESLEKALSEEGTILDGSAISVAVESRAETAVLVGVPYEAGTEYVKRLFTQCGEVAHIHEFSKTKYKIRQAGAEYLKRLFTWCGEGIHMHDAGRIKYKILRVTFHNKESVERALKLDRELRVNGFLVTVSKYRDEDEQKAHSANANKNKRQHPQQQQQNRNSNANSNASPNANPNANRQNNYRPRGGSFNARGNFRGGRGRGGFPTRGFPARGGFGGPVNNYAMPGFMQGGFMNDGQRPNKRPRM